eukprot:767178-Hanusia_phi.AAC.5
MLDRSPFVIGRDSTSNVDACLNGPLDEKMVSRFHCMFRLQKHQRSGESAWELYDLDSINGSYVNQKRITHAILHDGDVVTFGSSSQSPCTPGFQFCADAPCSATALRQKRMLPNDDRESGKNQKRVCLSDLTNNQQATINQVRTSATPQQVREQTRSSMGERDCKQHLDAQSVGGDLMCPICQDYLVASTSLQCSHL